jgi:hypothetical protein
VIELGIRLTLPCVYVNRRVQGLLEPPGRLRLRNNDRAEGSIALTKLLRSWRSAWDVACRSLYGVSISLRLSCNETYADPFALLFVGISEFVYVIGGSRTSTDVFHSVMGTLCINVTFHTCFMVC